MTIHRHPDAPVLIPREMVTDPSITPNMIRLYLLAALDDGGEAYREFSRNRDLFPGNQNDSIWLAKLINAESSMVARGIFRDE